MSAEEMMTPRAVAELHSCAYSTVQAAMERGDLQAIRVVGPGGKTSTWAIPEGQARAWSPDPERQSRLKNR